MLDMLPEGSYKENETDLRIDLVNGSQIFLKGAKDSDCRRGPGLDFIGLDEAQDFPNDDWDMIFRPLLTGKNGEGVIAGTKKKGSWFQKEWLAAEKGLVPQAQALWFPATSNPLVPAQEWVNIKKALENKGKAEVWYQEYISDPHTDDYLDTSIKYPEFSRIKHSFGEMAFPKDFRRFRAFDWGLNHPSACLWAACSPDGVVNIYDEYKKKGLSAESVAKNVLEKTGGDKIEANVFDQACWHTESDNQMIITRFTKAGINPVFKGRKENKDNAGANTVKNYLAPVQGLPKLKISTRCSMLMEELEELRWEDKTGDDLTDALRYLLVFLSSITWTSAPAEPQVFAPYEINLLGRFKAQNGFWNEDTGYLV